MNHKSDPSAVYRSKGRGLKDLIFARNLKIGLFGGSFNPAHYGHLAVAETALKRLNLDQVWWLVSPEHPVKQEQDTFRNRIDSVESLIKKNPDMFVSGLEEALGTQFSVDTLGKLKTLYPSIHFVWVMGADSLQSLHLWKAWQRLFSYYPIAVIARPSQEADMISSHPLSLRARLGPAVQRFKAFRCSEAETGSFALSSPPCWCYLTHRLIAISSTQIRKHQENTLLAE